MLLIFSNPSHSPADQVFPVFPLVERFHKHTAKDRHTKTYTEYKNASDYKLGLTTQYLNEHLVYDDPPHILQSKGAGLLLLPRILKSTISSELVPRSPTDME